MINTLQFCAVQIHFLPEECQKQLNDQVRTIYVGYFNMLTSLPYQHPRIVLMIESRLNLLLKYLMFDISCCFREAQNNR